ncbi:isochorismatase family protein [Streptomyces sp. NPDC004528]|uniref:cysteine hydrolase family protein n=1 Tax=Streptomyces sp. NPDC004528 TaxID=3154550 RepID=UPI0033A0F8ED
MRVGSIGANRDAILGINKSLAPLAQHRVLHHGELVTAIHERLAPRYGDTIVRKLRYDVMPTTELDQQVRERGITTLVLSAISTSGGVLFTVIDAADRDYQLYDWGREGSNGITSLAVARPHLTQYEQGWAWVVAVRGVRPALCTSAGSGFAGGGRPAGDGRRRCDRIHVRRLHRAVCTAGLPALSESGQTGAQLSADAGTGRRGPGPDIRPTVGDGIATEAGSLRRFTPPGGPLWLPQGAPPSCAVGGGRPGTWRGWCGGRRGRGACRRGAR